MAFEGFPADTGVPVVGKQHDIGYDTTGLTLEGSLEYSRIYRLDLGHGIDYVFPRTHFPDGGAEVLFHQDGKVISLSADTHLGHLAHRLKLAGHHTPVYRHVHTIGFFFKVSKLLVHVFKGVVGHLDVPVQIAQLSKDRIDLADRFPLLRAECVFQTSELGASLVTKYRLNPVQ